MLGKTHTPLVNRGRRAQTNSHKCSTMYVLVQLYRFLHLGENLIRHIFTDYLLIAFCSREGAATKGHSSQELLSQTHPLIVFHWSCLTSCRVFIFFHGCAPNTRASFEKGVRPSHHADSQNRGRFFSHSKCEINGFAILNLLCKMCYFGIWKTSVLMFRL